MIAYVDTSVLLRVILREPGAVEDLQSYDGLLSSELIGVESAPTIDRLRSQGALTLQEAAARSRAVGEWLEAFDLVLLRPRLESRQRTPPDTARHTLDAIHLATALLWREHIGPLATIATHDSALAVAARMFGFDVRGV